MEKITQREVTLRKARCESKDFICGTDEVVSCMRYSKQYWPSREWIQGEFRSRIGSVDLKRQVMGAMPVCRIRGFGIERDAALRAVRELPCPFVS